MYYIYVENSVHVPTATNMFMLEEFRFCNVSHHRKSGWALHDSCSLGDGEVRYSQWKQHNNHLLCVPLGKDPVLDEVWI
jgi:hypothetical protein